ncbi:hypothetical protein NHX12_009255 [Muraenolepis orangiensis]|uniref:Uncharacterized protein n=1 Tax=Muraenolepis orangiensis TaxID=630683 RepID=A0A9Q0IA63_9TELE|nr:hypothetical protein NHX12_009255 [Muraenolepis orangiensis]
MIDDAIHVVDEQDLISGEVICSQKALLSSCVLYDVLFITASRPGVLIVSLYSVAHTPLMIFGTGLIIVAVKEDEGLISSGCSTGIGKACIDARGNGPDCTGNRPDHVVEQLTCIN